VGIWLRNDGRRVVDAPLRTAGPRRARTARDLAVRALSRHEKTGTAHPGATAGSHDEAIAIAKRRLASGEITRSSIRRS